MPKKDMMKNGVFLDEQTFHFQWDRSLQVEKITTQQRQKSLFVHIHLSSLRFYACV